MEEYLIVQNFEQCRGQLKGRGWRALSADAGDIVPAVRLSPIDRIIRQSNGREAFEVAYPPGHDDGPRSRQIMGIQPDAQASGLEPPSKYLALGAQPSSQNRTFCRLDFSSTKTLCR